MQLVIDVDLVPSIAVPFSLGLNHFVCLGVVSYDSVIMFACLVLERV